MQNNIGFIGFGEAAQAIVAGWQDAGINPGRVLHYDIVDAHANVWSLEELTAQCAVIFSTVTAGSAELVAQQVANAPGQVRQFFDLNSISPEGKRRNAGALAAARSSLSKGDGGDTDDHTGIEYIDVAVMSPIHPRRHETPMLISCPRANALAADMRTRYGFVVNIAGDQIGRASTIKMLRSIMVKGVEALTDELMQAAQKAGVADLVLASLDASDASKSPRTWTQQAAYNIERMETHGKRRGDEMQEVVQTLLDLGVEPLMTQQTVKRQYARAK